MTSCKRQAWQAENLALDRLALLATIDDRRKVIRRQAWQRSGESWSSVYDEATRMKADIEQLRAILAEDWERKHEAAREIE